VFRVRWNVGQASRLPGESVSRSQFVSAADPGRRDACPTLALQETRCARCALALKHRAVSIVHDDA